jgi:soluble lytic murein transglycosylase
MQTESRFSPTVVGTFGEIGLMQVKPDTAAWIAKKNGIRFKGAETLKDVAVNVKIGSAYFAFLRDRFAKESRYYITAYNMGPRNMDKAMRQNRNPVEYLSRIMGNYRELVGLLPSHFAPRSLDLARDMKILASSGIMKNSH